MNCHFLLVHADMPLCHKKPEERFAISWGVRTEQFKFSLPAVGPETMLECNTMLYPVEP